MRVLMLSWEFPPHNVGGLGRHVAEIAPELAAQDIDLHIVTPQIGAAPSLECLGKRLTVHRVPIEPSDRTELVARVQHTNRGLEQAGLRLDHHLHFDLIHAHDWLAAYSGVALKYALQRPLVATIHSLEHGRMQGHLGSEQSLAINGIEAWVTHEAWRTITVSHYMAQQVHTTFDVPLNKIDVIYNGVTTPTTPALSPAARAAVRLSLIHI